MNRLSLLGAAAASMLIACTGCASMLAPEDAGFGDVEALVEERLGQGIAWNREDSATAALAPGLRSILQSPLTARGATTVALLNNRGLQAVYEDLGISTAALIQAGLPHNPMLDVLVKAHSDADVVELGVVQDFMSILTIPLRRAVAEAELEQAKLRVTAAVVAMATDTRMAFYGLQASMQQEDLLQETLAAAEAGYEAAKRLHEAGNITDLALLTERALYEQTRVALSQARLVVADRRERLNRLMGLHGADTSWEPVPALPDVPEDVTPTQDAERAAIEASLQLASERMRIERAGHRLGLARMRSVLPELAGGVEAEREPDHTWFVGPLIDLAVPIFDWGQASRREAESELRRAWNEYTALAVDVRSATRAARYDLEVSHRQALYYRNVLVPLQEEVTRQTQLQYNAMQLGVFSLLAAKQRELAVKRERIDAMVRYWKARAAMDRILAGGSPSRGAAGEPAPAGAAMGAGGGNGH